MRMTRHFGRSLREAPAHVNAPGQALLLRAGYIHRFAPGSLGFLPLGWRVIRKLETIVRQELTGAGFHEAQLPRPAAILAGGTDEPARRHSADSQSSEAPLDAGPEALAMALANAAIQSYRQLPATLFQIRDQHHGQHQRQTGLRDWELRVVEAFSFDDDDTSLDVSFESMRRTFARIFERAAIAVIEAPTSGPNGETSRLFLAITDAGPSNLLRCAGCGYTAMVEDAEFSRDAGSTDPLDAMAEVATPGAKTISEVASLLGVSPAQTLKAVFYQAGEEIVLALIRGDYDVNETKLRRHTGGRRLRLATEHELAAAGVVAGYASPVGVAGRLRVIADTSTLSGNNFVAGANTPGQHLRNVNPGRDFTPDLVVDIAVAPDASSCARCGHALRLLRARQLGRLTKYGAVLSQTYDATFTDSDSMVKPILLGSYALCLDAMMSATAETQHDANGLIWPTPTAPYQIQLVGLGLEDSAVVATADAVYGAMQTAGFDVLYDDRSESAGVKLSDADLTGLPIRVVISKRSLANAAAEVKARTSPDSELVPLDDVVTRVDVLLAGQELVVVS